MGPLTIEQGFKVLPDHILTENKLPKMKPHSNSQSN